MELSLSAPEAEPEGLNPEAVAMLDTPEAMVSTVEIDGTGPEILGPVGTAEPMGRVAEGDPDEPPGISEPGTGTETPLSEGTVPVPAETCDL